MAEVSSDSIIFFRSAADLATSEPSQLRRTIEELEARIEEQNKVLLQQAEAIQHLNARINEKDSQLRFIEKKAVNGEHPPHSDSFKETLRTKKLQQDNERMSTLIDEMEDGFWHAYSAMLENVDASLEALSQLPATSDSTSMYSRAKKEVAGIKRAKAACQISPVNALRQLADVEHGIIKYIISRPTLTFRRAEHYRAEFLIKTLGNNPKIRAIKSPEAAKILSAAEEKPISSKQARRAMTWAARLHPDKVMLNKRGFGAGNSWRLCKIGSEEASK